MYEEYYITLPGGFALPLALAVERCTVTELVPQKIPQEEAESLLSSFAEDYLRQTMIAGTIRSNHETLEDQPGIWILAGEYRCTELIGMCQRLQMGE